jgi:hypothetical protein
MVKRSGNANDQAGIRSDDVVSGVPTNVSAANALTMVRMCSSWYSHVPRSFCRNCQRDTSTQSFYKCGSGLKAAAWKSAAVYASLARASYVLLSSTLVNRSVRKASQCQPARIAINRS